MGFAIGVGSIDWFRRPLPPNRTCGSPASGSPVGGLTREGTDGPTDGCLLQAQRLPFGCSVSIRVVRSGGSSRSHQRRDPLRRFQPIRQYRRFLSAWTELHVSTFLHPFAPPALPGFIATMGALTPARRRDPVARSAPCGGRYLGVLSPLAPRRSPRFTCSVPPEPSVSNHPAAPHDRFVT